MDNKGDMEGNKVDTEDNRVDTVDNNKVGMVVNKDKDNGVNKEDSKVDNGDSKEGKDKANGEGNKANKVNGDNRVNRVKANGEDNKVDTEASNKVAEEDGDKHQSNNIFEKYNFFIRFNSLPNKRTE